MRRFLIPVLAVALVPCAARAALPGEMELPVTIVVPALNPSVSAAALGGMRLGLVASAPSLSLPSAPSPIPVVLPTSLPNIAPMRALRLDPAAHELDWSFLGGDAAEALVPSAPAPRPRTPSLAAARVETAARRALASADAMFDGARRALAEVDQ